ncbi:hypothetical protein [Desulfatitalea tepidiphila]|uniref:hypothetical protein n=1 Tax=Desulfatitalea tepidiphila TaxID=1185843 RepID=UPI0006B3FB2C|nr:hypothetical protein [Desulfatitalea tepidiphila]
MTTKPKFNMIEPRVRPLCEHLRCQNPSIPGSKFCEEHQPKKKTSAYDDLTKEQIKERMTMGEIDGDETP